MAAGRRGGSITIFAALSLMLVAQMLFVLLESARNAEYYKVLQMNTDAVLESVFAGYTSPLWDKYRLLAFEAENNDKLSFNCCEAEVRELSAANLGSGTGRLFPDGKSLLTAEMTDANFVSYLLMTDQQGKVFRAAVASYMRNNLAYEAAKAAYNLFESTQAVRQQYGDGGESIDKALEMLEDLKNDSSAKKAEGHARKGAAGKEKNVLTTVEEARRSGILTLVLPRDATISGAKINLGETVSHRRLEQGSSDRELTGSWYDQVMMNWYLAHYLTDYTDGTTDRGLNYELEYLIGGKTSDKANLKTAVKEILAIREAMNFASIVMSAAKQAEALALATLLVGVTLNPLIIEAVKYGILAAWAFVESILDLRALLSGEKVALMKNDLDWTSDLDAIPALLSGFAKAKSSPLGISYNDYLGLLLFFHSEETLAMRAMDVQEAAIRRISGYEGFRMDHLVCEAALCGTYSYVPVFSGFVTLLGGKTDRFVIQRTSKYSYLGN